MTRVETLALAVATTALTSALVAFSPLAMAQDRTGTNRDMAASAADGAVANLALAQSVYAHGVASGDALAVLTAARLMASVEVTDAERTVETMPTEGMEPSDAEGAGDGPVDVEGMVAMAKALAGDNEAILGLIADFEAEGARGRIGGPSRTLSRLRAGFTDVWTVPFYGGLLAEVAVLGDGDSDLDVIITDENGNTICIDQSFSDKVYCSWTPRWNGYFYVTVMNVGRLRNSYYILTN